MPENSRAILQDEKQGQVQLELWGEVNQFMKSKTLAPTCAKPVMHNVKDAKFESTRYFPIMKHWGKLRPIYHSREAYKVWWPNMVEYLTQKAQKYGFDPCFDDKKTPSDFEACDWRCGRRGRHPEYWLFVCYYACHWLVDLHLFAAIRAVPTTQWRIVSSRKHSTVWDGDTENPLLFDLNFLALGVPPQEALMMAAAKGRNSSRAKRFGRRSSRVATLNDWSK